MDDLEQAVSYTMQASADPQLQARANAYCQDFKASPDALSLALSRFLRQPVAAVQANEDLMRFFCLHVVEEVVTKRYDSLTDQERDTLRQSLMAWMRRALETDNVASYVWKKFAQVLAFVFRNEYVRGWHGIFDEIAPLTEQGANAAMVFLRLCEAVHGEVVCRSVNRTQEELRVNSALKDAMRMHSVQTLAQTWYQILDRYSDNDEVVSLCLRVIGQYVSWIDIGLVVNEPMLVHLYRHLLSPTTGEAAAQCFADIVSKGMSSSDKLGLLSSLRLIPTMSTQLQAMGFVLAAAPGEGPQGREDDEQEYLDSLARLVDVIVLTLVQCLSDPAQPAGAVSGEELLMEAVDLMLWFLGREVDDVSMAVVSGTQGYVGLLKSRAVKKGVGLSGRQQSHMQRLLHTITYKLRYANDYAFGGMGDDEAYFDDYRKSLLTLVTNMAALDTAAVVGHTVAVVSRAIDSAATLDFSQAEVALLLLHHMGTAVPAADLYQTTPPSPLYNMMTTLLNSALPRHPHRAVNLMYFECLARYWRVFVVQPDLLPMALESFFTNQGLNNPVHQVRSQACYIFAKFCRQLLKQLGPYAEMIFTSVQPLLVLSVAGTAPGTHVTYDDQVYLYEVTALFLQSDNVAPDQRRSLLEGLLSPLMAECQRIMTQHLYEADTEAQPLYTTFLAQAVGVVTRMAKSVDQSCADFFMECLKVFVPMLGVTVNQSVLRSAVTTFSHRMVASGGPSVMTELVPVITQLLNTADPQAVWDAVTLLSQAIAKHRTALAAVTNELLPGIGQVVYNITNAPHDPADLDRAQSVTALRQAHVKLLYTIASSGMADIFLSPANVGQLHSVLQTVVSSAGDASDSNSQKLCFGLLRALVVAWAGPGEPEGFSQYCCQTVVPTTFDAVLSPAFDIDDAQAALNVANEVALLHRALYSKLGDAYGSQLVQLERPGTVLTANVLREMAECLAQSDDAQFKKYFRNLLKQLRQ